MDALPRPIQWFAGLLLALLTLFVGACGIAMLLIADRPRFSLPIGIATLLLAGWCLAKAIRMITGRRAHRGLLSPVVLRLAAIAFLLLPIGGLWSGYYSKKGWVAVVQAVTYVGCGAALWHIARERVQTRTMTLHTDRLELTPTTPDDFDVLTRIWRDPDVRRYLWDDVVCDDDTAREVLARDARDWNTHRYGLWLIRERGASAVIGFAGFRTDDAGVPELIYGLLPQWWHRGYATEAATAALRYLFETLGHSVVHAATDVPNVASIRVLERLGMERQPGGPHASFRITREQFVPVQSRH